MAYTVDVNNTTELQHGECCCCLDIGDHRDLTKQYYLDKRPEIYEVLFKDTFGIVVNYPEDTKLICDVCIVELRQARHFRSMVESTQRRLRDLLNWQLESDNVEESSPIIDVIKEEKDIDCTYEVVDNSIQSTYKRLEELLTADQQVRSVKEDPANIFDIECIKQETPDQTEEAYAGNQCSEITSDFAITGHTLKTVKVRLTRDPVVEQIFSKTKSKREYRCDVCSYKTSYSGNLDRHMNTHTGKKTLRNTKNIRKCNKIYNCDFCSYNTRRREHIITHLNTHLGRKPYSCRLCSFKSTTSVNLKDHMRTHTGEKPFSCKLCKFKSARKCNLNDHMRNHTGEKPFSCDFCPYKASKKAVIKKHTLSCH